MKLTNKDKEHLLSIGYLNEDLPVIEFTIKRMRYEMFFTTKKVIPAIRLSQKQVIAMLGRETFLSGVGRATFHNSAVRSNEGLPNVAIYFERKKL